MTKEHKEYFIKLLKYKTLVLHIDATFQGAPTGFYQVLILSVMDQGTYMNTPVFFCPMTTKTEEAYHIMWMHIISCAGESSHLRRLHTIGALCILEVS
jgi:hypothetical protein